ncbi:uncharacterized protein BO80DRAFT_178030 [Aspergillus ibericus CBS 121593]|uniref:Zn(2)-C6 fungal-type domain-containing protein n=1 Tax=Aspergillus ibericus CBS 121593 TaxID=1448316 RepID=A0A395HC86_9EURO|nr:hypothetical protein BO80DRAFT_178030 [Aspergillus ibericus CBS 121593]RAL05133.1 hypothetical protein BO80DRAFT_178030 [Aspergillus ibericus CBS 121593]
MGAPDPLPLGSDRTSSALRRSCVFCRSRKIRCSGESICSACEKRNLSCVYSPEARKGRPKQKGTTAQPDPASDTHSNHGGEPLPSPRTSVEGASHSPESATNSALNDIVGDELERRFNVWFIAKSESCTNLFQNSIVSYRWDMKQPSQKGSPVRPIKPPLSYDGLLSFMASEMVGILPLRFSYLGDQQPDTPNQNYYVSSLAADTTLTMFDPIERDFDPLMALGKHLVLQLVDVWFSAHPLSPLVSKTLLTTAIQEQTVDRALLGVILADACEAQPITTGSDGDVYNNPQALFQVALLQLKQRTLTLEDPFVLSTVQAVFLIGWRELCLGHARRATCLSGYACRVIACLYTWQTDSRACSRKLNGVDVGVVERELVQNIYWLCLATTTWAFMQSDQPFTLLTPETTPEFPCLDETASAILHLDRASGNISTLQSQIQAMRCLWPLSHITSTVGHVYTLYLNTPAEDKPGQPVSWQKQHLHQLHQLFQPRFDRSVLASRLHRILLHAIELVTSQVGIITSRSFLLNAYHSIAIHMLFSGDKVGQERQMISPSTIDSFCQSASALLAIAQQSSSQPTSPMSTQVNIGIECSNMMLYGLDTCSRGLSYIYTRHERGSIEERNTINMTQTQLIDVAAQLYQACKGDAVSRLGSALLPVKKRFKRTKIAFELLGSSAVPSLPSGPNETDTTGIWAAANDLRLDPGVIDQLAGQSLNSSPGSLPAMAPDPSMTFPEHPTEVIDPGFFINGPVAAPLLGFPGLAKMNMQLQDYLFQDESDPTQDISGLFGQDTGENST